MVYNDLFNYGLFIHMTYLSYGRMSPQQKNNQQSSVFDMLYAFDWHYLYMSLSWKDGRRSIFQSIFMFLISTLTPWHKTQFSKNINFKACRSLKKVILNGNYDSENLNCPNLPKWIQVIHDWWLNLGAEKYFSFRCIIINKAFHHQEL